LSFAQLGDGFESAEEFFDSLALALSSRIGEIASGAMIDHAGLFAVPRLLLSR
jgi:hypothetical protein